MRKVVRAETMWTRGPRKSLILSRLVEARQPQWWSAGFSAPLPRCFPARFRGAHAPPWVDAAPLIKPVLVFLPHDPQDSDVGVAAPAFRGPLALEEAFRVYRSYIVAL